jgi:predicted membrane protein
MMHIEIDFTEAVCPHREVTVEAACGAGHIRLVVPAGWGVRVDGSSTNTGHIVNKATEVAEPGAPTVTVVGHPRSGLIKIKQRRR